MLMKDDAVNKYLKKEKILNQIVVTSTRIEN